MIDVYNDYTLVLRSTLNCNFNITINKRYETNLY